MLLFTLDVTALGNMNCVFEYMHKTTELERNCIFRRKEDVTEANQLSN